MTRDGMEYGPDIHGEDEQAVNYNVRETLHKCHLRCAISSQPTSLSNLISVGSMSIK
jgi:hypothetical protein